MKTVDHTEVLTDVLGPALRSLHTAIPHELAVLYQLQRGRLEPRAMVGPLASPSLLQYAFTVDERPRVQQALDGGYPVPSPGVELYGGVLELSPEHVGVVVPLLSGDERLGVLTFLGKGEQTFAESVLGVAAAYGRAVASTLALARRFAPVSPLGGPGRLLPLREAERRHLMAALEQTRGKIYGRDGAAKLLDLKPTTLQSKLKKHGINRLDAAGATAGDDSSGPSSGSREPSPGTNGSARTPSGPVAQAMPPMPAE